MYTASLLVLPLWVASPKFGHEPNMNSQASLTSIYRADDHTLENLCHFEKCAVEAGQCWGIGVQVAWDGTCRAAEQAYD